VFATPGEVILLTIERRLGRSAAAAPYPVSGRITSTKALFLRSALVAVATSVCGLASPAWAQSADLTIGTVPAGISEAIRGQEDTVTVTITNNGDAATASTFDVTIYLSADETPSSVEKVGDLAVSTALAVGENRTLSVPVRVPSLQTLGDYLWLAQVDAADVVAESNEGNNIGVGNAISFIPEPPDLVVSAVPSGPVLVPLCTTLSVVTAIQNVGEGASSVPFDVSVYLSSDATFGPEDTRIGRVTLPDTVLPDENRQVSIFSTVPADFPEGNYNYIVVVNADGDQPESNNDNNVNVGTPVSVELIQPDLSLVAPPSGESAVFRGVTTDVTVQITNSGDGATDQAFDVVVYISEDPFAGNEDDIRVGDVAVTTEIAVGATQTVVVPARVSAVQATGVYYWIALVDDGQFINEGDEANNSAVWTPFSVLVQPSDLFVATAPTGPALVIRNSFQEVNVDIQNQGTGATTGAFQVSVYLSNDDVVGDDDDIRNGNVTVSTPLIEGEVRSLVVPVIIPSDQATGSFKYLAIVDATGVEVEINGSNNASLGIQEVVVSQDSPDLAAITDPFGPAQILREGAYTVSSEVQNQSGGILAEDFTVSAILSSAATIGNADDVTVGETLVSGGLISGEVVGVEVPVTIPVGFALGSFRWGVVIDAADVVSEVNEANNARVGSSVTVESFPTDLVVGADLVGPGEVSRGRLYTIPLSIQNAGQGETIAGFDVAVYLSVNESIGDDDDLLVGVATVDAVFGPGQTREVEVPVIIPADQPPLQFRWAAIINPEGQIVEGGRTNNAKLGNLVSFPVLDLPESLSFGSVTLGQSKTRTLEITDTGTAELSFDVESLSPLGNAIPPVVDGLAPGETQIVTITVTPTSEGTCDGDMRITSDLRGPQVMSLGGVSVIPNRDRVRVDLDMGVGIQDQLTQRLGVNQTVDLEHHVQDLPDVSSVTIQVTYDPEVVSW